MKKTATLVLLSVLTLSGCLNREVVRYSEDWPQLAHAAELQDFAGRYPNTGEGAGHRLWDYLTEDKHSLCEAQVVISVPERTLLRAELTDGTNVLKSVELEREKDFILKSDHLRLPTQRGFESGALGSGAGYAKFYLYRTEKGGLSGKYSGSAVGLFLHVIPTLGFGSGWTHWPRIEAHGARAHLEGHGRP